MEDAYYRSERRCKDVAELQIGNKEGHFRRLPRRLSEGLVGVCGSPVFVVALCWKFEVEANIEMLS